MILCGKDNMWDGGASICCLSELDASEPSWGDCLKDAVAALLHSSCAGRLIPRAHGGRATRDTATVARIQSSPPGQVEDDKLMVFTAVC